MTTTYPRIDADRGMAAQVVRFPGRKVCARLAWQPLASIPRVPAPEEIPAAPIMLGLYPIPPEPSEPLRGFLLESHRSLCLTACLTVIRDTWPKATQQTIHCAIRTARRILEGGGTVRAAVYHALNHLDGPEAA